MLGIPYCNTSKLLIQDKTKKRKKKAKIQTLIIFANNFLDLKYVFLYSIIGRGPDIGK